MAWIEDSDQNVLLVRQAGGLKLWTLPGGKVKRGESLVKALKREVYEESGLRVQIGSLLGVLDRRDKDAITLLFAVVSNEQPVNVKKTQKEIKKAGFQAALPKKASPSAKYFWSARKGPVKKPPKIRASTHQFPETPVIKQLPTKSAQTNRSAPDLNRPQMNQTMKANKTRFLSGEESRHCASGPSPTGRCLKEP
jgi:ADP-ribose pyrophosphatase YjhB (NUDIX family)